MCGRFTLVPDAETIQAELGVAVPDGHRPRYNISPGQDVLAIVRDADRGEDRAGWLRWGLIPRWAREPSIGNKLINARAETVATKPAFRAAFRDRRCLIVADGFYEWATVPGTRRKQPYWIHREDGAPFALAGLWERWGREDGEMLTCTIITTEPIALVRPIHDRMPVVLSPEDRDRWLDPAAGPAELTEIARRPAGEGLEARPVALAVNSPAHDEPDCIEPLETGE